MDAGWLWRCGDREPVLIDDAWKGQVGSWWLLDSTSKFDSHPFVSLLTLKHFSVKLDIGSLPVHPLIGQMETLSPREVH